MPNPKPIQTIVLSQPFVLGNINIDPDNIQLSNDQQTLSCEPKVFEILLYFCSHSNQLVSRDQLLQDLWQGKVVSDNAVNRKIYQLRKLLQSLDSNVEYINTVPKKGYRLVQIPTTTKTTTENDVNEQLRKSEQTETKLLHQWWLAPLLIIVMFIWFNQMPYKNDKQPPQLIPLTSLNGIESYPAFSADQNHLIYSYSQDGQYHQLKQLNIAQMKTEDITPIVNGQHDIGTQWHPKENKIAFIRINNDGSCSIYQQIFDSTSAQTKPPQNIFSCDNANLPTISWGAGKNQLFIAERARKTLPYQLFSLNTATGAKLQLSKIDNHGNTKGYYYIQRNANGSKMVSLLYLSSNKVQVTTYKSRDFTVLEQFELDVHIDAIAWQNQSEDFYFKRNHYIEKVNRHGTNREMVFHVGQDFSNLRFNATGDKLVFNSKANVTNIYQYDITSQQLSGLVVASTKQDKRPAMANLSNKMAFISDRSGINQFWLSEKNLSSKPMKTIPYDIGHSHFAWSLDDSQLLFEYKDQIHLYKIKNGESYPVIASEHQAYHASWSTDGTSIIYSSNKTGDWQLWQLNLSDQSHKQLTNHGGYSGHTDKNGKLYFSKYHQNGLFQLNPDGSETRLIEDFSLLNWLNWQIKDDFIYFAKIWGAISPEQAGIYRYNITTGEQQLIMPQQAKQLHDYTISNDGEFIRFTRLEAQAGDITMLDLNPN